MAPASAQLSEPIGHNAGMLDTNLGDLPDGGRRRWRRLVGAVLAGMVRSADSLVGPLGSDRDPQLVKSLLQRHTSSAPLPLMATGSIGTVWTRPSRRSRVEAVK